VLACGVGEVLWDIFPDKEMFGGAALNFCANLQRLGDDALLLSAVGTDMRGKMAMERMHGLGLSTHGIQQVKSMPTGIATVSKGQDGEPGFCIPRPAAFDAMALDPSTMADLVAANPSWLYFGTLLQTNPQIERLTAELVSNLRDAKVFYDINLRRGHWTLPLVKRLSRLATIMKLNESEAQTLHELTQPENMRFSVDSFCKAWASSYGIDVICVTLGGAGCAIYAQEKLWFEPGFKVSVCDTVGSGDAFASGFLHGYALGWPVQEIARFANALGAVVASLAGATPQWTLDDISALTTTCPG